MTSVAAQKVSSIFRNEGFATILALKIESFRNIATIFKISAKIVISKCWQKLEKILESIVYVISQLIFFGGSLIVQGGSEELPIVSPKVSAKIVGRLKFGSSKFHQNRNTTSHDSQVHAVSSTESKYERD